MKKHLGHLLLVLPLFLCLFQSPAHAETLPVSREKLSTDSLAELRTVVPEGVTEIDLRVILGDDAREVKKAWMQNADICILLRSQPEDEAEKYGPTLYELIVLDMQYLSILSRTPVPNASYYFHQGREDDAFRFWFTPIEVTLEEPQDDSLSWMDDAARSYICVSISRDGTVDIGDSVRSELTVMPGGKIAIRTAIDGSLYGEDLTTGKEDLLIQGIPRELWQPNTPEELQTVAAFEAYAKYVPCWDELEDWDDKEELDFYNTREFHVSKPLDEFRFVYTVSSWEWSAGYGIYDLQTRTDHQITRQGDFFGMVGDTLFGESLKASINTYESARLPELVREQFEAAARRDTGALVDCDISPDGKSVALTGMMARSIEEKSWWDTKGIEPKFDYAHTITLTNIETGDLVKAYDIYNPFATESTVSFYANTLFMLFCTPKELGSAYIYLLTSKNECDG